MSLPTITPLSFLLTRQFNLESDLGLLDFSDAFLCIFGGVDFSSLTVEDQAKVIYLQSLNPETF